MFCKIYKSIKYDGAYLYVKRNGLSYVPERLLDCFGTPQLVMILTLKNRNKLANADILKVKEALKTQGYYLQIIPYIYL